MKSQLEVLEQDLKVLQTEFKKKNTQIKDVSQVQDSPTQRAATLQSNGSQKKKTRTVSSNSNNSTIDFACQPKELLEPLQLIFQLKASKNYSVAISCLQKIAQIFTITDVSPEAILLELQEALTLSIVEMLREATADLIDEMTQIRVLQLLLTFLDPKTTVLSKEFVNSVLQCCFQMFDTKSNAVKSTIQATLKTLLTLITDNFTTSCKQCLVNSNDKRTLSPEEVESLKQIEQTRIYDVVHDLLQKIAFTLILNEQNTNNQLKKAAQFKVNQAVWNLKPSQNAKCVMLDLINLVIQSTKGLLVHFAGILNLFELQIIPTLQVMLGTKQVNSLIGLRQMKCTILIIQNLQIGISMLQQIVAEADTLAVKSKDGTLLLAPSWRNLIGFECLQIAIGNAELTKIFSQTNFPNQSIPILLCVLETFLRAAKAIEANQSTGLEQSQQQYQQYIGTQKIAKLIDSQQIDNELAAPSAQQIERIIIESVCTFSDNFVHVFQTIGVKLGTCAGSSNRGQNFAGEDESGQETLCKQLLQMSWKPLLDSIQRLIKSNIDEASCQMLLKAYQSCIGACGSANCFEARDSFLHSLCLQCVQAPFQSMVAASGQKLKPVVFEYQINERNILMCKTLLNIAHCLCHILDVKSWFMILETMQNIEIHIQRRGLTSETHFKQPPLNFNELRQNVSQKMQDFNIIERSQNKGGVHHTRISSVIKPNLRMQSSQSVTTVTDERSLDIQILQDSLNSLFTSSLLFDEQSLAELVCALAQLTVTKFQDTNGNDMQDFGLRRLIETALVNVSRIDIFWKIIMAHFEILGQSKDVTVRQYTIEALQMLVIEIFSYKKQTQNQITSEETDEASVFVEEESKERIPDESWLNDSWQYTVLQPFSEFLKSSYMNDKILVLKCLEKIIQVCGQQVRNDGWRIIILSISKSVEAEQDQVTTCGFRCLKLIVSNYISKLSLPNFRTVLNAIHLYASSKGDNINNNLIAISMFQNVADYIARQIKAEVYTFKNTWLVVFERIKNLGQDHRAEVRRANIHTLDNIVMTHGATFITTEDEDEVWPFVLEDVLLGMLEQAISRFEQNQSVTQLSANSQFGQPCQTPQFSSQKKINFEEASVVKALKKYDEQWQDTCSILAETACRTFKKYVMMSRDPLRGAQFWENLVTLLCRLLNDSESGMELCKTIFKSLSDLAPICSAVISQDSINQLLRVTKNLLEIEIEKSLDERNQVLRLLKSVPVLVESLRKIFEQTELFERNTDCLYQLLVQLTKCSGNSDGYLGFGQPNKLLSEEKVVFDFVEQLCTPTIAYFEFLFQFLVFEKDENRSEAFIRRSLQIFYNAILRGKLCPLSSSPQTTVVDQLPVVNTTLFFRVVPQLLTTLAELVELRYNEDAAKVLIFNAKGQPTLFYTCGLYIILISSFLTNPEQFKARIWAHQQATNESRLGAPQRNNSTSSNSPDIAIGETGGVQGVEDQTVLQKYPLLSADQQRGSEFSEDMLLTGLDIVVLKTDEMQVEVYKQQAIKDAIWEQSQKLVTVLQFEPSRLKSSNFSSEVLKSSQDLDIQTINFIVNCLLPNSVDHNNTADFEQQLIQTIDQGCQQLSNSTTSDSLSKYCLNNLFELCKQQVWPSSQTHDSIRKKIAHIATPILVNRCRLCLKKFIQDEQKSGSVQLSRQRVSEVTFILRKLHELESNDKDHLIQLMPVFAEMILSNEQQLKEILYKIFLDISSCITQIYPQTQKTRCSSGGN